MNLFMGKKLSNTEKMNSTETKEKSFYVCTYELISETESKAYVHWSKGLKMIIKKDGVKISLNSEEIEQLVKSLPRTLGGTY